VGEVGLRRSRDATDYRTVIADMLEDTDRLSNLVERLLLLSKGDTGQIALSSERIDLCDLTRSVVSHLSVLAEEKEQSLTADCRGICHCRGDRLVLRQALINLVDNAVKYTPRGGQIHVQVTDGPTGPSVEVSDTGPGVPSTFRHRMFDRFWRGSADGAADSTGDGLGLALAKWAVEANHGALTYEESEPRGSVFRVRLPKVDFVDPDGVAARAEASISG
jgi:signal transduction histidine kinase